MQTLSTNRPTRTRWLAALAATIALLLAMTTPTGAASAQAASFSQTATAQAETVIHSSSEKKTSTTPKLSALEARVLKNSRKSSLKVTKANKKAAKAWAKKYVRTKYKSKKKANTQYKCLEKVFHYESKWNWKARSSAGYYGLPQTKSSMRKHGKNWKKHYEPQIKWGFNYMKKRYGSPCGAWSKIKRSGWY